MKDHKGIVVAGFHSLETAMGFNDFHKEDLEKLGYYLIVIPADEDYINLLSVENVTEIEMQDLLKRLE